MKKKHLWFSLIELIIVIVILAILAVIAIMSISKWINKSKDTANISDLSTIEKTLTIYLWEKSTLPKPDNSITLYSSWVWNILSFQWEFWSWVISTIWWLNKTPKDRLSNKNFVYTVSADQKNYQLLTYIQNISSNIQNKVYAEWLNNTSIETKWNNIWIILKKNDYIALSSKDWNQLNLNNSTWDYKIFLNSEVWSEWTWISMVSALALNNTNNIKYDYSTILYTKLTNINSNWTNKIQDYSQYQNHWECHFYEHQNQNYQSCNPQDFYKDNSFEFISWTLIDFDDKSYYEPNNITACAWFKRKANADQSWSEIINKEDYGSAWILLNYDDWDWIRRRTSWNNATENRNNTTPLTNNRVFACWTSKNSTNKLYINWNLVDTKNTTFNPSGIARLAIWWSSRPPDSSNNFLVWNIKLVHLYNRWLSDQEIKYIYEYNK